MFARLLTSKLPHIRGNGKQWACSALFDKVLRRTAEGRAVARLYWKQLLTLIWIFVYGKKKAQWIPAIIHFAWP